METNTSRIATLVHVYCCMQEDWGFPVSRWMAWFSLPTSDVRIQASRIRIQPPRIRIQLNLSIPLFSWIRIRIQLLRIWIRIRIQLDIGKMANSSGVIRTRNIESGFESESESTMFFLNPNLDSYFLALNLNPAQKALDLDSHITASNPITSRTKYAWVNCQQSSHSQV